MELSKVDALEQKHANKFMRGFLVAAISNLIKNLSSVCRPEKITCT